MQIYPLKCEPEFKERVWGGRNLERFGYKLPEGNIGEAWTIGDHPNGTTRIANGVYAGKALNELREELGEKLLGHKGAKHAHHRFPLLIKLLDCEDDLSVQVHPNDTYARLPKGEFGKTEMWYVLDAKPGAKIIYGLRQGVTREALASAIEENRVTDCLQEVSVQAGDCFYIPAGTVHALCAGILVAEIQQNSDTTYRLYDYNRPGLDGKPRELHIEDSLNVTAYDGSGAQRMTTELKTSGEWLTLAESPYFLTEKGLVDERWSLETNGESFHIVIVCEGSGGIVWGSESLPLTSGECVLVPAAQGKYELAGHMTVLRTRLP